MVMAYAGTSCGFLSFIFMSGSMQEINMSKELITNNKRPKRFSISLSKSELVNLIYTLTTKATKKALKKILTLLAHNFGRNIKSRIIEHSIVINVPGLP